MNCIRCGKTIPDNTLFCEDCEKTVSEPLQESAYLNTQILLPVRKAQQPRPAQTKPVRKAERKGEEETPRRRGTIAFLTVVCLLLLAGALFVGTLYLGAKSDAASLEERVAALEKDNSKLQRAVDFADAHAAFVPNDGSGYYHTGDCIYFDKSSFMVYNVNTAKARGYEPCPYCHPAE
ncbi:MAG: hypothetical protein IJG45_08155 [Oscillospiraceae bacterium]|nr:hypothetical protein [Oscillospiraceae bacterium]